MKSLIVGNWKMNPATQEEAVALFEAVKAGVANTNAEVVICPPFVYLGILKGLKLGAQNVSREDKGAFTGAISVWQLKDLGVEYVIVGHSERRKYFHETDSLVNARVKKVLEAGLKPILCVGENEGEDRTEVLTRQLTEGLREILNLKSEILNLVVTYEPVWAIGTGKNCAPKDVAVAVSEIKKISGNVRVIYGGSVNSQNAKEYLEITDGLLVGGASLKPEEFTKIVKSTR